MCCYHCHCHNNCVYACGPNVHVWSERRALCIQFSPSSSAWVLEIQLEFTRLLWQVHFSVDLSFWTPGRSFLLFSFFSTVNSMHGLKYDRQGYYMPQRHTSYPHFLSGSSQYVETHFTQIPQWVHISVSQKDFLLCNTKPPHSTKN